jgi:carboxyl-terminal processing protease
VKNFKIIVLVLVIFLLSNVTTFFMTWGVREALWDAPAGPDEQREETPTDPEEMALFFEVLKIIKENYVDSVDMKELEEGAIQGMLEVLDDPQTNFFNQESMEDMMSKTLGSYSGIGIVIDSQDNYITVISPIKGTPGERAGLLPGDRIIEVDGQSIMGISTSEAANLMRGPKGESVTLQVERAGVGSLEFTIVRDDIDVESVFPEMLEENVGYIYISNFDRSTGKEFEEALLQLEKQGMKGLVLDLRDNPGGLLAEAVRVARAIVPEGPITHVVDGSGNTIKTHYSELEKKPYPIVVLVNAFSASASEIVAGALQDSLGAELVGTRTFGKATVQNLEELTNQGGIRYTVAKYLTPNRRNIHGEGLNPDHIVELTDPRIDSQLEKALSLLKNAIQSQER